MLNSWRKAWYTYPWFFKRSMDEEASIFLGIKKLNHLQEEKALCPQNFKDFVRALSASRNVYGSGRIGLTLEYQGSYAEVLGSSVLSCNILSYEH
jgi:hypothetical protein